MIIGLKGHYHGSRSPRQEIICRSRVRTYQMDIERPQTALRKSTIEARLGE
ncbi:hypothetical protein CLOSS21_00182 [Clostridium sp. SS2/1]|nr:hypothetical protein CLOSS21_00182 [Clostridium sp. SS2/1]